MRCELCGEETGERLCHSCWELRSRVEETPWIACKILAGMLGKGWDVFCDSPAGKVAGVAGILAGAFVLLALTR